MALRNKSFGSAQEFCWSHDSSVYCIRESNSMVKIFKNFKEQKSFKPDFGAEGKNEHGFVVWYKHAQSAQRLRGHTVSSCSLNWPGGGRSFHNDETYMTALGPFSCAVKEYGAIDSDIFVGIHGGHLLGVRSVSGLAFYDWDTTDLIRRIEITPKNVSWTSFALKT